MEMLAYLTGKNYEDWDQVSNQTTEEKFMPSDIKYSSLDSKSTDDKTGKMMFAIVLMIAGIVWIRNKRSVNKMS